MTPRGLLVAVLLLPVAIASAFVVVSVDRIHPPPSSESSSSSSAAAAAPRGATRRWRAPAVGAFRPAGSLVPGVLRPRAAANEGAAADGVEPAASSAAADAEGEEKKTKAGEKLTAPKIAEMIEATFVRACLQLATGYVDVLKLFVVAVKAGYESGVPVPSLIEEVERCPANSAGRDLMDEEKALRNAWINVVYMVLAEDGHDTDDAEAVGGSVDFDVRARFGALVRDVVAARRSEGGAVPTFEEVRRDATSKYPGLLDERSDAVQVAVVSQSLRVADLTLTVVDEERQCHEGGGAGPAPRPRPPIPGAFQD